MKAFDEKGERSILSHLANLYRHYVGRRCSSLSKRVTAALPGLRRKSSVANASHTEGTTYSLSGTVTVPLKCYNGYLYLQAKVGDVEGVWCILDTGSNYFNWPSVYAFEGAVGPDSPGFGITGPNQGTWVLIPIMEIGDFKVRNLWTVQQPTPPGSADIITYERGERSPGRAVRKVKDQKVEYGQDQAYEAPVMPILGSTVLLETIFEIDASGCTLTLRNSNDVARTPLMPGECIIDFEKHYKWRGQAIVEGQICGTTARILIDSGHPGDGILISPPFQEKLPDSVRNAFRPIRDTLFQSVIFDVDWKLSNVIVEGDETVVPQSPAWLSVIKDNDFNDEFDAIIGWALFGSYRVLFDFGRKRIRLALSDHGPTNLEDLEHWR